LLSNDYQKNAEEAPVVSISLRIDELKTSDMAALAEFMRSLDGTAQGGKSADIILEGTTADSELTSQEKSYQRETMRLLKKFEERGWRIAKSEIPEINKKVFAKVRRAAAVYRSNYFRFDRESQTYVGTEGAKAALSEWRREQKVVKVNFGPSRAAGTPSEPRLLRNRMVLSAMENKSFSFFSDLTAEGLGKLEASMSEAEKKAAKEWLVVTVGYFLEQFGSGYTLTDCLETLDNWRACLDLAARSAKEDLQLNPESRIKE
jgi:hypothetical protein